MAGITTPNDGKCHLENNEYTESSVQDYPSISQINMLAKKHSVNIIFAVVEDQLLGYEEISQDIEGSSVVQLRHDSSNIVDLVREQFNVSLNTNFLSNLHLKLSFA